MFKLNGHGELVNSELAQLKLKSVQTQGNDDVSYKTDRQIYGVDEKWAYPKREGFKLVGDCEDISLYKRKLLVDMGIPSSVLLLTICLDPNGAGHCVLSVVTDKRDYVLCNNHRGLATVMEMQREGYKFLYRQQMGKGINEPWDVLK